MTSSDSMTRFLIRGGQIYDHDEDIHQPAAADLLINGDIIERVEPTMRQSMAWKLSTRLESFSSPALSMRTTIPMTC